jgi:hypothetical protein
MTVPEGNMKAFQIEGGNLFVPSAAVDSIGVLYPGERVVVVSGEQITHMTIDLDKEYALNLLCRKPAHGVTGISSCRIQLLQQSKRCPSLPRKRTYVLSHRTEEQLPRISTSPRPVVQPSSLLCLQKQTKPSSSTTISRC